MLLYSLVPFDRKIILSLLGATSISTIFPVPKSDVFCCVHAKVFVFNLNNFEYPENTSPTEFNLSGVTQFPDSPEGAETAPLRLVPVFPLVKSVPPLYTKP